MKRLLAIGFIVGYLGVLNYGLICHVLNFRVGDHPLMYFIVWDMFCGWTAYDSRTHIIAEGESQKLYELTPPPWGELHPWGDLGRQHYDAFNNHTGRMGLNTLRHTRHEPITRLFVVEESWAKKYNIPEVAWQARYDEPREIQKYYRVRTVLMPDGMVVQNYTAWTEYQAALMLADNPRLQREATKSRPMFILEQEKPGRDMHIDPGSSGIRPPATLPIGAPLVN